MKDLQGKNKGPVLDAVEDEETLKGHTDGNYAVEAMSQTDSLSGNAFNGLLGHVPMSGNMRFPRDK